MRRALTRFAVVAAVAVSALIPASAGAQEWRAVSQGCIRSAAGFGCSLATGAAGIWNVAVSPDGLHAYGVAWDTNGLVILDRNSATGQLTPRATNGCFVEGGGGGCGAARGLFQPDGVAVSPDGRSVYVGSRGGGIGAVAVFARTAGTGALTYKQCVSNDGTSNGVAAVCTNGRGLAGVLDVIVSGDNRNVYAGPGGAIATFTRNLTEGANYGNLAQPAGTAGCIAETPPAGDNCDDATGLQPGGRQIALSPDGNTIYAGGGTFGSVAILDRSKVEGAAFGALNQAAGTSSCLAHVFSGLSGVCTVENRLFASTGAAVSPDGKQLYVSTSNGVVVFARTTAGKLAFQTCINDDATNGCVGGRMMKTLQYVAVSPDGENVIVTADANPATDAAGLAILDRDGATGNLSQRASIDACVSNNGQSMDGGVPVSNSCRFVSAMGRQGRVTFAAPLQFYAGAYEPTPGTLIAFKRDFAPVCPDQTVDVTRDASISIGFGCSDRNGDTLTYAVTADPLAGTLGAIDQAGARIFYNPFAGFVGADSFKFRASATPQTSAIATISLNVVAPPAPPGGGGGGGGGGTVQPSGIDSDKDGFFAGQDCNDGNAAIRPGAVEVKGNRLDENCDGLAEPFPTVTSGVASKWDVKGNRLTLTSLQVTQQFPKGWKVLIKCSGKPKCSFKTKSLKAGKVKRGAATVISSLSKKQRKFRAGQTLEVWVSAPNFNTKVARLVLRKGKVPTTQPFCVLPGQTKPQKTCT